MRQQGQELEASLDFIMRPCLNKKKILFKEKEERQENICPHKNLYMRKEKG
jgi:hypothetical protein